MKKNITQPLASMPDHLIHSPLRSISWCIVLRRADGPQADPAVWPPDSSADKRKHSGCEFMTMKKLLPGFRCVAQVSDHFIFTANSEEMLFEVKVHEDTAHSPHVNAVTERQAQENFWSPDEERRRVRGQLAKWEGKKKKREYSGGDMG